MSDDDTRRAAVSPPLSCANVEAASSASSSPVVSFQEPLGKGETVSERVKVTPATEPAAAEVNDTGADALRSNDHEAATKVKQRKCVQFTTTTATPAGTTADDTLRKFFEGEEILDKRNPFKPDDQAAESGVRARFVPGNEPAVLIEHDDADDSDTEHGDDDNVFITKEEILRQSKYVKTYIKNPDKQLNYDKSVIQKLNALKAKGREVRDVAMVLDSAPVPSPVAARPPIPAPRTVQRSSDRNNNNSDRRQASPQQRRDGGNPKPVPRARRDYAEVKVRIGSAEAEESLYDSNEVVQNALKFDSRFRKVEFGSQDDIDSIAERTEDGSDPRETISEHAHRPVVSEKPKQQVSPSKDQPDAARKTTFAEDVKKSFSNTVKSADFRKYLQSKGLSLVPAKPKAIEAARSRELPEVQEQSHRLSGISVGSNSSSPASARLQLKPSVLTRFFQNGLFSPKTRNDPAYSSAFGRSSTPVLVSTRSQPPARFASFNGGSSLHKRSAVTVDGGKPKVNFKQLVDGGRSEEAIAPVRRPASVNDFERPKLRTHIANRSVSSVDSLKRPVRNAGVQVNLATPATGGQEAVRANSQLVPLRQPPSSSNLPQQQQQQPAAGLKHQQLQHQVAYQSLRQRPDARFYGGSTNTVVPLYSEPLREAAPIMALPDETDSGFRSAVDNGYHHIYEQTPDNVRRGELVYGKIGYLSNTQLNRWHAQDRRSYSSMQDGGTYGRLRPLYVSSPLSTQSTPVRRASDTIDREQILHRIYDFCRRSIRNSSRTSVHSNHTEPQSLYQSKVVPTGGPFPIERQRVQRVQSLTTPRSYAGTSTNYTRAVAAPPANHYSSRVSTTGPSPNQHERNIENIYAFVNKKMGQVSVGPGEEQQHGGRARTVQTSAPATLRRVTFSSNGRMIGHTVPQQQDGIDEADYVNIRGAPDDDDWQNDKSNRNQPTDQAIDDRRRSARSREDPRRHTLGGDMLQYQAQTQPPNIQRSLDFETPQMRVYTPTNQGPLFDDDPGIMSEAETASTGFRRGGKQRSSLPVVRTPSKTLERPLGLVFLQYRSETKRALLPNEITSIDTVRALFVRSFPRQLTMQYLEGPNVKIYIHDSSKDMFYELEDVRSHLREIRDRSVLRLFESNEVSAPQVLPGGQNIPQPLQPAAIPNQWDQEQSYFSEPEFDSEYQHQHIHKSKQPTKTPYYVGTTQTLPRGMYSDRTKGAIGVASKPIRSYGSRGNIAGPMPYTTEQLYNIPDGYMSSPERSGASRGAYEEPYYSQYGTRSTTVTPIIDEEQGDISIADDQYAMYGVKNVGRIPRVPPNQMYDHTRSEDLHRIRVEHMERQLANLTGLVQKALTQNPQLPLVNNNPNILNIPGQYRNAEATGDGTVCTREKPPKLGKSTCHKSVSFEKSVSFSDDIQGVPKSHSPQHSADTKPPKPAIKSSTLPRTSSQERDRLKPPPPPKPLVMIAGNQYRTDLTLAPEVYNQLRGLQKKAMDLRTEVRTLRRLTQTQAVAVREDIKDTFMRIRATLLSNSGFVWGQGDKERTNLTREEEIYKQEVIRLEKDLADLESSVEGLRGEVINRRTRVNMVAVEDMALVLSRASKTVAELKMRFPVLQQGLRNLISNEMEHVCREEAFLKDEPDRLENALRRCKKLTGTLVTLKRLASVQEQRLPIPDTAGTDEAIKPPETHNNVNKFNWRWSSNFKEAITDQSQVPVWGQSLPVEESPQKTHSMLC
ncbi:uncharacterized protein LOC118509625 isoform X4 [Anopheles stephensi]|uniref:uncharacterized protein LOC118509625 isoform X4 n=1 Tax=Anopheles stephensi TaxID=30069 RepID=UPI0016589FB6|nr:uncharacterized protein LOC118509625 isoform X4 [Anopheles stephensi]